MSHLLVIANETVAGAALTEAVGATPRPASR